MCGELHTAAIAEAPEMPTGTLELVDVGELVGNMSATVLTVQHLVVRGGVLSLLGTAGGAGRCGCILRT